MSLLISIPNTVTCDNADDLHDALDDLYCEYRDNPYVSESSADVLDKQINNFWGTRFPEMDSIFLAELSTYERVVA